MRYLLLLLLWSLLPALSVKAQDTFDIQEYEINLTIGQEQIDSESIVGHTTVRATYPNLPDDFEFALLDFTVDSVLIEGQSVNFNYDGQSLSIPTAGTPAGSDSVNLAIYYQGQPAEDPIGGGFFFEPNFIYNIGAGLEANPHPFGRAWYPAQDDFQERARYEFFIKTLPKFEVFCNGALIDTSTSQGLKTFHWRLDKSIPTYLSSIAIAPLARIDEVREGIPLMMAAKPEDTAAVRNMFQNFGVAARTFQDKYGPYRWNKAGFVFTPFRLGAIEHATSVHMPDQAISLGAETIMAHEFAHSWFGNLVTCDSAVDMWLNEGWAVFSEALFLEETYGRERYRSFLRNKLKTFLQFGHTPEGDSDRFAIKGIPHEVTYGTTVFNKGCLAITTLREQLGDEAFFSAIQVYLEENKWGNVSTETLQAVLERETGADLSNFFDTWIKQPGFPHFRVDSFRANEQGGTYAADVFVSQRLRTATKPYELKVEVAAFGSGPDEVHTETFDVGAGSQMVSLSQIPFQPTFITVDPQELISDARIDQRHVLKASDQVNFDQTDVTVRTESVPEGDSAFLQVSHHFIGPTHEPNPTFEVSPTHYWEVKGRMPAGFEASTNLRYDATTNPQSGYLDRALLDPQNTEDVVLLYREGPGKPWELAPDVNAIIRTGSGFFLVEKLRLGQYAIGRDTANVTGLRQAQALSDPSLELAPNPAKAQIRLTSELSYDQGADILIRDALGRQVKQSRLPRGRSELKLSVADLEPGIYFLSLRSKNYLTTRRLVVE